MILLAFSETKLLSDSELYREEESKRLPSWLPSLCLIFLPYLPQHTRFFGTAPTTPVRLLVLLSDAVLGLTVGFILRVSHADSDGICLTTSYGGFVLVSYPDWTHMVNS